MKIIDTQSINSISTDHQVEYNIYLKDGASFECALVTYRGSPNFIINQLYSVIKYWCIACSPKDW